MTEIKLARTAAAISIVVVVHLLKRGPVAAVAGHEGGMSRLQTRYGGIAEGVGANECR